MNGRELQYLLAILAVGAGALAAVSNLPVAGQTTGHTPHGNRELQATLDQRLIEAVKRDDLASVRELLKKGARGNAHDNRASRKADSQLPTEIKLSNRRPGKKPPSALHIALGCLSTDDPEWSFEPRRPAAVAVVRALIDAGADVNEPEADASVTPLMMSIGTNDPRYVRLLLRHGAKVNAKVLGAGATALFVAAMARPNVDQTAIVRLLLANGADVCARDRDGNTALTFVRGIGRLGCVKMLVEKGADVNSVNKKGLTVLSQMKTDKDSFFPPDNDVLEELRKLGAHE